jgi:hypothetical protein
VSHFIWLFIWTYVLPFMLATIMPGWRSLVVCGVLVGAPILWANLRVGAEFDYPVHDPGIVVALALGFYGTAGIGFASGITTRAVTLGLRRMRIRRAIIVAVVLFGFVAPPGAFAGLQAWQNWVRQPPSQACLDSEFKIELAGMTYALPAAPLFTVITNRGDTNGMHMFSLGPSLREFCALSQSSAQPIHATALHLRFADAQRYFHYPLWESHCRGRPTAWVAELCRSDVDLEALRYPYKASLYSPDEYDHQRMLISNLGTYARFRAERAAGRFPQVEHIGNFERYAGDLPPDRSYWIAREGTWTTADGAPFTLYCGDNRPVGTLDCTTTYVLENGLQVTYDFRAPAIALEDSARSVDGKLRALLAALATESGGR